MALIFFKLEHDIIDTWSASLKKEQDAHASDVLTINEAIQKQYIPAIWTSQKAVETALGLLSDIHR
jgi:hypothetical protein